MAQFHQTNCCNNVFTLPVKIIPDLEKTLRIKGFLDETESLVNLCTIDKKNLEERKITGRSIADYLLTIMCKFFSSWMKLSMNDKIQMSSQSIKKYLDNKINISPTNMRGNQIDNFTVLIKQVDLITCPFDDPESEEIHQFGNDEVWIMNEKGKFIHFNNLLIHTIYFHNFFGGLQSNFRLNPLDVIDVLEIKSNVDYRPQFIESYFWCQTKTVPTIEEAVSYSLHEEDIKARAAKVFRLTDESNGYVVLWEGVSQFEDEGAKITTELYIYQKPTIVTDLKYNTINLPNEHKIDIPIGHYVTVFQRNSYSEIDED